MRTLLAMLALASICAAFIGSVALAADVPKVNATKKIATHREGIEQLAFADDGKTVVGYCSGSGKFFIRAWNVETGTLAWEKETTYQTALCPDGKRIVEDRKYKFVLVEVPSGTEVKSWPAPDKSQGIYHGDQKFTADGKLLIRRNDSSRLVGWDLAKGELAFGNKIELDEGAIEFKLLPDGQRAIVHSLAGGLYLVELATGKILKTLDQPQKGVTKPRSFVAVTGDGKSFVASVWEAECEVRSTETGDLIKRMPKEKHPAGWAIKISPIASPPGTNLIFDGTGSGSWDVWNCDSGKQVAVLVPAENSGHYTSLFAFTADGNRMATADSKGVIFIWDLSPLVKAAKATPVADKPPPTGPKPMAPAAAKIAKRTWTSADGKFKVVAMLERIAGESVELKKEDGKVLTVPLANLSPTDKKYVEGARRQLAP